MHKYILKSLAFSFVWGLFLAQASAMTIQCPETYYPYCPNGLVEWKVDDLGCRTPRCEPNTAECADMWAPQCGRKTINCITYPCPEAEPKTYSNICELKKDGALLLYTGACNDYDSPLACSEAYNPVCAIDSRPNVEGIPTTFGNACKAKQKGLTVLYEGVCGSQKPANCPLYYRPYCGRKNGDLKTYTNACLLEEDGAEKVHSDKCGTACSDTPNLMCGMLNGKQNTYTNECYLVKAGAKKLYEGTCQDKEHDRLIDQFPNCKIIYDGCNMCKVEPSGGLLCTLRACPGTQTKVPRCMDVGYNPPPKDDLLSQFPDCKRLYDGCNTCTVGDSGQMACTKRACIQPGTPLCLDTLNKNPEDLLDRYDRYKALYQKRPTATRTNSYTVSSNKELRYGTTTFKTVNRYQYGTYKPKKLTDSWREAINRWRAR
ncbi:MAG TPA: hypothetical protein VIT68_01410 [Candidatus Gracilibacteria bacterium]